MLKHKSDDLVVKIDKGIQIIIRSLFFLYWAIDNYLILNKVLLNRQVEKGKSLTRFWIYGSVGCTALGILQFVAAKREEASLLKTGNYDEGHMKQVRDQIRNTLAETIRNICEVVTASDSLGRPAKLFGMWAYNEGFCASCGLTSAIISCSQYYFNS